MRRYQLTPILTLLFALSAPSAWAGSYTINFTLTAPSVLAPTSGTFDYDPASGFSNFLVDWDGEQYDLTASANSPSGIGCGTYNAALSFALIEGLTPCESHGETTTTDFWAGSVSNHFGQFVFTDGLNNDEIGFVSPVIHDNTLTGSFTYQGGWTVTESTTTTPEPTTAITALLGAFLILMRKREASSARRPRCVDSSTGRSKIQFRLF
jgi:hypothetical protein